VAVVGTDVWEECIFSFIRVKRLGDLRKTLALTNVLQLLVTANVFPSLPILFTLMMEVIISPEVLVLTTAARRHIPKRAFFKPDTF
jgi:hypothetical protein